MTANILSVRNLRVSVSAPGGMAEAVSGVSFDIQKGEVFGLVGESGSGKTMTALSILRLLPETAALTGGSIIFDGKDILGLDEKALRSIRGSRIAMVFQEPSSALNPVFTIGFQMTEAIKAHQRKSISEARDMAMRYLERVHIQKPERVFGDYPHQISGGMKQRVMIAVALLNSPELLILDEPTTALDVTIQAQILDLLDEIIKKERLSMLFISHDFGIISRMCDDVAVMYKGRIVETGSTESIMNAPKEAYTASLLESVRALI